ncbi:MAG: MBL fold metallo-hydrolase [Verrucomicrobiota bacterium]
MKDLPLDDEAGDIIGKAQSGLQITDGMLADQTGLARERFTALRKGEQDMEALKAAAAVLGLHVGRLQALAEGKWCPKASEVTGLKGFTTPFMDFSTNAFVVWDAASKKGVAFDSGMDAKPILEFVRSEGIDVELILITHTHQDHVARLPELREGLGNPPAYCSTKESETGVDTFEPGKCFTVGGLKIETRLTWGHSPGGTTFVISGLEKPVAIVGDALIAGSIGGPRIDYDAARDTIRSEIFSLPDETILCSGHGPLTTVGEEKAHNPFFPEFAK